MTPRLTPLDIQTRTFGKRKIGGIHEEEVARFLREVAREMEETQTENQTLREEVSALRQQMKDYTEMERTLKATLASAQKASGDLKDNARREAELTVRNAEMNAERIIEESRKEVQTILAQVRELKKARRNLRIELKNVLDTFYGMLKEETEDTESRIPPAAGTATTTDAPPLEDPHHAPMRSRGGIP